MADEQDLHLIALVMDMPNDHKVLAACAADRARSEPGGPGSAG